MPVRWKAYSKGSECSLCCMVSTAPSSQLASMPYLISGIVTSRLTRKSLAPDTRGLIDAIALARMKPTAVLVNTSRGPVVDQAALATALRDGVIAAAGLDVTDPEPIPTGDPLLGLANCIVLPHIASATLATRGRMAAMAAANLLAGVRGEPLPTPVTVPGQ